MTMTKPLTNLSETHIRHEYFLHFKMCWWGGGGSEGPPPENF